MLSETSTAIVIAAHLPQLISRFFATGPSGRAFCVVGFFFTARRLCVTFAIS